LGSQDKLKRASIQADVFLNSQKQFMEMILGNQRQSAPAKTATFAVVRDVLVDQTLIGLIVGSQGSQLKRI
jgi:hypothetical protein